MKKRVCILLLSLCLAGCGNVNEDLVSTAPSVEEVTEETESQDLESVDDNQVSSTEEQESETEVNTEKVTPLKVVVAGKYDSLYKPDSYESYAHMTETGLLILDDGYHELKAALQKENAGYWKDANVYKKDIEDIIKDFAPDEMPASMPWEYEGKLVLERADNKLVSYWKNCYSYYGGAHPSTIIKGYNFDSKTGKKITIDDITDDKDALYEAVVNVIEASEQVDYIDSDWKDKVLYMFYPEKDTENMYTGYMSFMIKNDKVVFHYDTYCLGSYAAGPVDAYIEGEAYDTLIKSEFKVDPATKCRILDHSDIYNISCSDDFNGDGKEEFISIEPREIDEYGTIAVDVSYGQDKEHMKTETIEYALRYEDTYIMQNKAGKKFLYVETSEENDYGILRIYDLSNPEKGPEYLGVNENGAFRGFLPANSEHLYLSNYISVMGTYGGYTEAYVADDGKVVPYKNEYRIINCDYERAFEEDGVYPTESQEIRVLTALQNFTTLSSSDESDFTTGEEVEIKKGDICHPYATDGSTYMILKLEDGSFIKLVYDEMNPEDWGHKINGIDEEELFEGIMYAG